MTTASGHSPQVVAETSTGAHRSLVWLATRQVRRGTAVILFVVPGLSALVVAQYRQTFADALDGASLQALAENPAIRTLFGTPVALDDPGGFTVWRTGTFGAVLVGVWALLTATRITRGEEDAGRWDLLMAGRLRLPTVVGFHLGVVVAAQLLVGCALAAAMTLAGTDVMGSVRYGTAIGLVGVFFAAVGTCTAQLVADRRTAAGIATAVLGTGLLLRMIADGVPSAAWLRWLTPFGLLAETGPYSADRVAPLVVLFVAGALVAALATAISRARDLGAGAIPVADTRPARTRLLSSLPRFAVRRSLRGLFGWAVGLGAYFLLIGLLASSLTGFLTDNPRFAELAAEAGFTRLGTVEGYVGALYGLLGIPLGIYAASRVSADAADEAEGRFTMLYALPVSRTGWARASAAVATVACLMLAMVAGAATWLGTGWVGAPLGPWDALSGALNAVPVSLLCLGAALLALGWAPRAVLPIGVLPAAGGYLLYVLAQSFGWPQWMTSLSPFAHVAAVPAAPPDWPGTLGILAIAVALATAGAVGFSRRDLRG